MTIYWNEQLDRFGKELLERLGESSYHLPGDYNPVTRALRNPNFVEEHRGIKGFSRVALCRVATVCQMAVFDAQRGPENDGKQKALRRHWYAWFKTEFAQPLSQQLGEDLQSERWGLNWSGRLSQVYAAFVNGGEITYKDLWVEDASRMMEQNYSTLFNGCHIIVAVEKDSLFSDFTAPAKALGAKTVYSGKGKSSKAAIEKVLREHFNWYGNGYSQFTADEPLIILHISDHDFDGEAVIGPTFGQQASRYSDHILEARVGIRPETVIALGHNPVEKWYQVKVSNSGYVKWATSKAMFSIDGLPVQGNPDFDKDTDIAYGYEVEALKTRDYYGLLVDALLQVLDFDYIVSKLRDECVASAYDAARTVTQNVLDNNKDYQTILNEFERLEKIKNDFESKTQEALENEGSPHIHDWRYDDPDPKPSDYRNHVQEARDYASPWRPFDTRDRTNSLSNWLQTNRQEMIEGMKQERIL